MLHIQRAGYGRVGLRRGGRPGHSYYTTLAVDDIASTSCSDLVLVPELDDVPGFCPQT